MAEFDSAGTMVKRYMHGPGVDEPLAWFDGSGTAAANRHDMFANAQGSIIAITNGSGATETINRYDEFGIPQPGNAGRFGYTGQAWIPELGLSYYKARMYSPSLGRFMQTDPIGYNDGPNWYDYVGGDPINGTDPSGLAGRTGGHVGATPIPYCPTGDICVKGKRLPKHDVWSEKINIQAGIDQFRNIGVALGIGDGDGESNPCATSSISKTLENVADGADTTTLIGGGILIAGVAIAAIPVASAVTAGGVIAAGGGVSYVGASRVNTVARSGLGFAELANNNTVGAATHFANAAAANFVPNRVLKMIGPVAGNPSLAGKVTRMSANVQTSKAADVLQAAACSVIGN